jgi:superfamily II DNA/RNA helicase
MWEPPSSAAALVHRAGRTARAGEPGRCLLPLLPSEEPYIDFINRNQKIELEEIKINKITDERRNKARLYFNRNNFFNDSTFVLGHKINTQDAIER